MKYSQKCNPKRVFDYFFLDLCFMIVDVCQEGINSHVEIKGYLYIVGSIANGIAAFVI